MVSCGSLGSVSDVIEKPNQPGFKLFLEGCKWRKGCIQQSQTQRQRVPQKCSRTLVIKLLRNTMVTFTFYTQITAFSVNSQLQRNVQKHRSGTSALWTINVANNFGWVCWSDHFRFASAGPDCFCCRSQVHLTAQRNHTVLHWSHEPACIFPRGGVKGGGARENTVWGN